VSGRLDAPPVRSPQAAPLSGVRCSSALRAVGSVDAARFLRLAAGRRADPPTPQLLNAWSRFALNVFCEGSRHRLSARPGLMAWGSLPCPARRRAAQGHSLHAAPLSGWSRFALTVFSESSPRLWFRTAHLPSGALSRARGLT